MAGRLGGRWRGTRRKAGLMRQHAEQAQEAWEKIHSVNSGSSQEFWASV